MHTIKYKNIKNIEITCALLSPLITDIFTNWTLKRSVHRYSNINSLEIKITLEIF